VLSGIQPTGEVHLGNYLGAIRRWVDEQDRVDGFFCIVDLHAITLPHVPAELRERTLELATTLLAAGIDPDRSTLFVQSHVHEHSELAWILNCVASMGELSRMVQWKEKSADKGEFASVGLFDYPVLQAADILLYRADEVPVGDDQRQHIELTRDVAQRFNHRFGEVFNLPKATHPPVAARVMDLQTPTNKMSKSSESPKGTVPLLDEPSRIAKRIKAAVTDSGSEVRADRENKAGITNLIELLSSVTGDDIATIEARYEDQLYGTFKSDVAEAVVEFVRPVQDRYRELTADPGAVGELLAKGADKAGTVAAVTLAKAKDAVGFLPGYR
jgi:tryptophanyl-tRNA synthetase